ncbi:biotin/lipoyl-containing protein [Paucidesulfovibrio longus]|uniref:biotin/lipoyl-containing protein n=1 Tax=Paucidesulfovibrio longus TaxID=889 RepID=UPI0003B7B00C|nr:biotin/lipoyl-containing protein [Paucidesulfovibrio longus]
MGKKRIRFMCTAFRDGFQSVYGARVLTKDFLPAVRAAAEAGIDWFEAGGGARFQALYFYCNEDAFAMMDAFREAAGPDADLQTLARGVNVVGLESQSSDVVELHAKLFARHGITSIRNFDALNDVHNLDFSGRCIKKHGLNHQICVSMMELPPGSTGAHDPDFYEMVLRRILEAGIPFDSVCFKDASGTSTPGKVHETIKRARKLLPESAQLHFHTHETAGISIACYLAAIEAGADAVDLSLAPVSGGTCQPDVATLWHALRGTDYDLGVDIQKVLKAEEVFADCMSAYFLPPEARGVEPTLPFSPMPGGALTANTQMLRDNGIMHKYPEIIAAMGEVVRKGGFGTSVTPVSQFYFQQAFNNVMFGPWARIADGYGKMVLGYFGRTPVPPDPDVIRLASSQLGLAPTDKTPLELNDADPSKGLEAARRLLRAGNIAESEENLFIAATCKDKGVAFLNGSAKLGVRWKKDMECAPAPAPKDFGRFSVSVNGRAHEVTVRDGIFSVDGKAFDVTVAPGAARASDKAAAPAQDAPRGRAVNAPMPGVVVRVLAKVGEEISKDQPLLVLEAMKMEVEVRAPEAGRLVSLTADLGRQVAEGDEMARLESGA